MFCLGVVALFCPFVVLKEVFALQIVAKSYPPKRLGCSSITGCSPKVSGISAVLHTAAGSLPLDVVLGHLVHVHDASFIQQDFETLVATINRHISAVDEAPVAIHNDVHPSPFASISARGKFPMSVEQHNALLTQQNSAVLSVNFQRGGIWVSSDSLDASTARLTKVSVHPMHAYMTGSDVDAMHDSNKGTMHVKFLGIHAPTTCMIALCLLVVAEGAMFLIILPSHPDAHGSCMHAMIWQFMLLLAAECIVVVMAVLVHMRRVVCMEVSPCGRFWKLQRSVASPPLNILSMWKFAPLESYIMRWTQIVAEGFTDDLRGCEVCFQLPACFSCSACFECVVCLHGISHYFLGPIEVCCCLAHTLCCSCRTASCCGSGSCCICQCA